MWACTCSKNLMVQSSVTLIVAVEVWLLGTTRLTLFSALTEHILCFGTVFQVLASLVCKKWSFFLFFVLKFPLLRLHISYHAPCIHNPITKRMRVISPRSVDQPVIGFKIFALSTLDGHMLDVSPSEVGIGLQNQGHNASCHRSWGRCASVGWSTAAMEVSGYHFALSRGVWAVSWCQGAGTGFWIPAKMELIYVSIFYGL